MQSTQLVISAVLILTGLCLILEGQCFNLEERTLNVKQASQNNTYFGFSVAQHKDLNASKYWMLVGAPLGQNLQPLSEKSGALFKCPITGNQFDCEQIATDGRLSSNGRYRFTQFDYDEDSSDTNDVQWKLFPPQSNEMKTDQWLGVTVKSEVTASMLKAGNAGKVVVCAHRYTQIINDQHFGPGLCYVLNNALNADNVIEPCKGRYGPGRSPYMHGLCQGGTSLAIMENSTVILGAPGVNTWRGTIFVTSQEDAFLSRDKYIYQGPIGLNVPIEKYSYLGMSVTVGRFIHKDKELLVAGAPRYASVGRVYFFEKIKSVTTMMISLIIDGEQIAASFGYELLVVDANSDGFDDLLVAAPFYFNKENLGGAVYIFYNLRKCFASVSARCQCDQVLYGRYESRFGLAMTNLGDINKDGYPDVAIGAPYEENSGAIYIYLGSSEGINREPSQIIRNNSIRTLGYSLSGGLDMDSNDYPDLLVGAYESDMVILYRTRPIVDIAITLYTEELHKINTTKKGCLNDPHNKENTCFSFKCCFTLNGATSTNRSFTIQYQIKELPSRKLSRIWFRNRDNQRDSFNQQLIPVERNSDVNTYCQNETVYIKDGIGDILTPIKFLVNYSLVGNEIDSPILNKTSVKDFEATFQKSCGDDDVCESHLVLKAGTHLETNSDNVYIVNLVGNEEFLLYANVTNYGESAYETKLFVEHPDVFSYIALQSDINKPSNVICSYENDTLVVCNLGNPLQERRSIHLILRFEINRNRTTDNLLNVHVFINSTSKELSEQTSIEFQALLQKIADYTIEGRAITPQLFYSGPVKGESAMHHLEDIGARVHHIFHVTNMGQWDLRNVDVRILWPFQVQSSKQSPGKWLLYLEAMPKIDLPEYRCQIQPMDAVNPLRLNYSNADAILQEEKEVELDGDNEELDEEEEEDAMEEMLKTLRRRKRRDLEYIVPSEVITGPDGKQRTVVTMDCTIGTARCARIVCRIERLQKREQIRVRISSRIWNSTLVEDYSNVDWVRIRSFAEVTFADHKIIRSNSTIGSSIVETIAYPGVVLLDTTLSIWIIIAAITVGILLLILLIFILYKVGFFERHRFQKDPTVSGSLHKQGESESLLMINESANKS